MNNDEIVGINRAVIAFSEMLDAAGVDWRIAIWKYLDESTKESVLEQYIQGRTGDLVRDAVIEELLYTVKKMEEIV